MTDEQKKDPVDINFGTSKSDSLPSRPFVDPGLDKPFAALDPAYQNPFVKKDLADQESRSIQPRTGVTSVATVQDANVKEVKKVDTHEVIRKGLQAEFDRNKKRIERKAEILAEYGNLESLIPIGHEYWSLSS